MLQASQLGEHCFEGESISGCHATGDSTFSFTDGLEGMVFFSIFDQYFGGKTFLYLFIKYFI